MDHACRALRAAIAIRRAVDAATTDQLPLSAAVGVSSGPVVAGNIGSRQRFEYTVIGDPVNEAARLTEVAKAHPSRVLASGATVSAAGSEGRMWTVVDTRVLRGRSRPTSVFAPTDDDGAGPPP
ncbi:MAG: adenylate/guanylate cyclase domain-containing protein [Actinomycetota bacterium]|nr:adenylate/guanylate cyclase domain-containing protein [Actinomycetota bacterium]